MKKKNIAERRVPEGITARYQHLRDENRIIITTVCRLINNDSRETLKVGYAHVSPKDMACKKIGRAISLGRALKLYFQGEAA